MIFVKDDNNKIYLKGTDVEVSTEALIEIGKQVEQVLEGNITELPPVNQKKARVLKSFRTQGGAEFWQDTQRKLGKLPENVTIVKSLEMYSDVGYDNPPLPSAPLPPVHVVIEETMEPVAEVISVKDSDTMFKMMYKKGLLDVSGGVIMLSDKFYSLLGKFTEKMLTDTLKSAEVDENGRTFRDVGEQILKASPNGAKSVPEDGVGSTKRADSTTGEADGKVITQEEASNTDAESRKESVPEDGVGDATRKDNSTSTEAPGLLLSQEEADNKNASPEPISDDEAKSKQDSTSYSPERELSFFKSLYEVNSYVRQNEGYKPRPTTLQEKLKFGRRYNYAAEPTPEKDENLGAFGHMRRRQ